MHGVEAVVVPLAEALTVDGVDLQRLHEIWVLTPAAARDEGAVDFAHRVDVTAEVDDGSQRSEEGQALTRAVAAEEHDIIAGPRRGHVVQKHDRRGERDLLAMSIDDH